MNSFAVTFGSDTVDSFSATPFESQTRRISLQRFYHPLKDEIESFPAGLMARHQCLGHLALSIASILWSAYCLEVPHDPAMSASAEMRSYHRHIQYLVGRLGGLLSAHVEPFTPRIDGLLTELRSYTDYVDKLPNISAHSTAF